MIDIYCRELIRSFKGKKLIDYGVYAMKGLKIYNFVARFNVNNLIIFTASLV